MSSSFSSNPALTFFGRFEEKIVFLLFRNWVILDLNQKTNLLTPIGPILFLKSASRSLKISWRALGFEFSLKSKTTETKFFFSGEIHSFNIYDETEDISVSLMELPKTTFGLKKDIIYLSSIMSKAQLIAFPSNKLDIKVISYPAHLKSDSCLVFIHGGPFQRFTNEHNGLLNQLNSFGWPIFVPQYCGDPTIDNGFAHIRPDSSLQLMQLFLFLEQLRKDYKKIYCFAHSYGCYLGKLLLDGSGIDGLISLNGVFDMKTLKSLSPVTFADCESLEPPSQIKKGHWLHVHSKNDSVVPLSYFYCSLSRSDSTPHNIEVLESSEHEILDLAQQDAIARKIQAFIKKASS